MVGGGFFFEKRFSLIGLGQNRQTEERGRESRGTEHLEMILKKASTIYLLVFHTLVLYSYFHSHATIHSTPTTVAMLVTKSILMLALPANSRGTITCASFPCLFPPPSPLSFRSLEPSHSTVPELDMFLGEVKLCFTPNPTVVGSGNIALRLMLALRISLSINAEKELMVLWDGPEKPSTELPGKVKVAGVLEWLMIVKSAVARTYLVTVIVIALIFRASIVAIRVENGMDGKVVEVSLKSGD